MVDPTATDPAVAAICAIIPGPLEVWDVAGGAGACAGLLCAAAGGIAAVWAPRDWVGAGAAGLAAGREERDERYEEDQLSL